MSELFAIFKQHLIWALVLWVLFFAAFAMVFAGRQVLAFAKGVGRVLLGIVVSPFVFIRRAVESVLRFTASEEETYRASDQYLLNKAMLILQALVIVIAIGLLSAGAVATWNAWVPSAEIRREAREYETLVEGQRVTAKTATDAVTKLDSEWTQAQTAAVARYRKERLNRKISTTQELTAIEKNFATYGSTRGKATLADLQQRVRSAGKTRDDVLKMKRPLDRVVSNNRWWLAGWESQALERWNEFSQIRALADAEIANIDMNEVRSSEQPSYAEIKATNEREAEKLASMEERLKVYEEAASLKWKAATWTALGAFVTFLLFVWLWGALIELGWLAIRVADDIRRMRQASVTATLANDAPVAVRVPIRENATPTGAFVPPPAGA
jgi:hypothetical protein